MPTLIDLFQKMHDIAGIYIYIYINNGNTRTICKICSKLTIKAPTLMFQLLTLNK